MKKTILTAAIAIATVFGLSYSSYAATTTGITEVSTMLTDVKNFSEIEVHGNVQVYLTTGNEDQVKVYNNYYADDALVQEENGVLRVTSYTADKLVVWVTVSDLSKLSVFDNAEVKTFGQFSALDLVVNVNDHAKVQLDMDANTALIALHDCAKADISGSIETARLVRTRSSYLNKTNLTASSLTEIIKPGRHMPRPRPMEFASL